MVMYTISQIPRGVVDMTPLSQPPPISQPQPMTTPISADLMSPSGVRISLGGPAPRMERKNSHSGQPPLDDQRMLKCVIPKHCYRISLNSTRGYY